MMRQIRVLPIMLLVLTGTAMADVFVHVDAMGVTHYTNAPEQTDSPKQFHRLFALMELESQGNRAKAPYIKGTAEAYASQVHDAAIEAGIEPALVHAVITAESGYNPKAVSKAGAQGLMQLMPETAQRYAVEDAFDPAQNIRGGARYLRDLMDLFDNDVSLAVAAYNAGENAVMKYDRQVPPYPETRAYVPKVLRLYNKYAALSGKS